MELLQEIWTKGYQSKISHLTISKNELQELFESKTKTALNQINRNMRIDAIIMIGLSLAFISSTFLIDLQSKWSVSLSLLGMTIFLMLHYHLKYYLLNNFNFENHSVIDVIKTVIRRLKIYRTLYLIIIPSFTAMLYILLLRNLFYYEYYHYEFNEQFWLLTNLVIPLIIGVILLVRKLFIKMYGQKIRVLHSYLEELQE